jgi:hypothetical protein
MLLLWAPACRVATAPVSGWQQHNNNTDMAPTAMTEIMNDEDYEQQDHDMVTMNGGEQQDGMTPPFYNARWWGCFLFVFLLIFFFSSIHNLSPLRAPAHRVSCK